jgi:hypothetical protein
MVDRQAGVDRLPDISGPAVVCRNGGIPPAEGAVAGRQECGSIVGLGADII